MLDAELEAANCVVETWKGWLKGGLCVTLARPFIAFAVLQILNQSISRGLALYCKSDRADIRTLSFAQMGTRLGLCLVAEL